MQRKLEIWDDSKAQKAKKSCDGQDKLNSNFKLGRTIKTLL